MNEEEKSIYSDYMKNELSSDENTCHKIIARQKSYKKSNNSPFVNKRVSDHRLQYSDLSCVKLMSYNYKKVNAELKNSEKENEVFHRDQRSAFPTDEFNSNRFHSMQRIRGVQSSGIFNNQEIPSTSFSDDSTYSSTYFSDNCTVPSTGFSDNRPFASTSLSDNRVFSSTSFSNTTFSNTRFSANSADPSTSFSKSRNFPSTSFSDNCAVPSTSFSDIRAFPSTSSYDDQVVWSKSFSDNRAIQSTSFSDGKGTSRARFKKYYGMGEEDFAVKVPTDLHKSNFITRLFENLALDTSSDNESIEVNVSDSSDYESMTEAITKNFFNCKTPDSFDNKRHAKQKKRIGKSLSNLESLPPIQKFHSEGNSGTVVTQTRKKKDIFNEDYEKFQGNRKRSISEKQGHSLGTFDVAYGLKKFKPL